MLVDDHAANFNKTRAHNYHPSDSICVDESMYRWYGIRGNWINANLPQYIVIDRNPENDREIPDAADGVSGIIIQLKLVKTSSGEDPHYPKEHDVFWQGLKVMLNIFQPWVNKQRRVVSAER